MAFASSGPRALELLEPSRFDVVVSDKRMPGMDGAQLLAEIKKRCPDTLRFILSGQSEGAVDYRSIREAHQFLSKPCKPKSLKEYAGVYPFLWCLFDGNIVLVPHPIES